jgi:hypothetical protein
MFTFGDVTYPADMNHRPIVLRSLQKIEEDINLSYTAHWLAPFRLGHLLLVETIGKEREGITNLIVQLALRGSFNLIAGDEWLPDRDTLMRLVRRYTLNIEGTLDNPRLRRPMTCLQLLDVLMEADKGNKPTMITNFLHHFYNADVELSLRDRILEQCCQYTKRLSLCNSVVVLVPRLDTDEYKRFFPVLASIANEIIPVEEEIVEQPIQGSFF